MEYQMHRAHFGDILRTIRVNNGFEINQMEGRIEPIYHRLAGVFCNKMIRLLFFLSVGSPLSFPSILAVGEVALREMFPPTAYTNIMLVYAIEALQVTRGHHLPLAFHVFQVLLLHQVVP